MASDPNNKRSQKPQTPSWKDNLRAFKNLSPFLRLIWETNPYLTLATIFLRLIKSGIPLATLYVGKLIIDEVVDLMARESWEISPELWQWILIELGLALLSDIFNRIITLVDALLGDLFANESSVRLMQHASKMDLAQFENANFYDKLERARRQTTTRICANEPVFNPNSRFDYHDFLGSRFGGFQSLVVTDFGFGSDSSFCK